MSEWKAKFERLKDAIRIFTWREIVPAVSWTQHKDTDGYRMHVMKQAARALGEALLRDGLLELKEWDEGGGDNPHNGRHIIQVRAEALLPPGETGTFASQLDDAERVGYIKAIDEIREAAANYARLDMYGPVQALALRGLADDMQRRAQP